MKHDITIMRAKKKSLSRLVCHPRGSVASRRARPTRRLPICSARTPTRDSDAAPSLSATHRVPLHRSLLHRRRPLAPLAPPPRPSSAAFLSFLLTPYSLLTQCAVGRHARRYSAHTSQPGLTSIGLTSPMGHIKGEQPRDIGPLSPASGPSHPKCGAAKPVPS